MTLGPLMVDVAGCELTAEDRRVLSHPLVGAVILFTRNFDSYEQLVTRAAPEESALGALEEPRVERALAWWKKLRL